MAASTQLQKLTHDDVAKHNKDGDLVSTFYPFSRYPRIHPFLVGNHRQQGLRPYSVQESSSRRRSRPPGSRHWLAKLLSKPIIPLLITLAAGQDATDAFYGLHRHEVLERPQYQRLQIGYIDGEKSSFKSRGGGEISKVPYAENTWLVEDYYSPYYKEVRAQLPMRCSPSAPTATLYRFLSRVIEPSQAATGCPQVCR
jgi:hypothetical protein